MQRHQHWKLRLGLGLALILALSACSGNKNQNPVASGDEVGSVSDKSDNSFSSGEEKPNHYTARKGDTLRRIAGRPEIYGDPNLWPILQEANADKVGHGMAVNQGVTLSIPRDLSDEQIQMAHEKARQIAAESKMGGAYSKHVSVPQPTAVPASPVAQQAAPTPVPPAPVPMPKSHGILMPVLIVLLILLLGLAAVLFFYMRKESKEEVD